MDGEQVNGVPKYEMFSRSNNWILMSSGLGGVVLALCTIGRLPWWYSLPAFFPLFAACKQISLRIAVEAFYIQGWFFYAGCMSILLMSDSAFETFWFLGVCGLAFLHAAFGGLLHWLVRVKSASLLLLFPIAWTAFEFSRFHLTWVADGAGFTLATVGNSLASSSQIGRLASLGGSYLLSTVLVAIASCLYCLLFVESERRRSVYLLFAIGVLVSFNNGILERSVPSADSLTILVSSKLTPDGFAQIEREIAEHVASSSEWIIFLETALHWHHLENFDWSLGGD